MSQPSDIRVYAPDQRRQVGWLATWGVMFARAWRARPLIWQLFRRDFLGQYRRSFLGLGWLFLSPLAGVVSWIFLQRAGVLAPGEVGVPYPVYVLVGSLMWGLFTGLFQAASDTLHAGRDIILQVRYPHEALLFKQLGAQLAAFLIGLALNGGVLAAFGVMPSLWALTLPLVVMPLVLLASGLGIVASMVGVMATDLKRASVILLGLAMWTVPVVYGPQQQPPWVQTMIAYNPLTHIICSCRDIVLYGRLFDPVPFAVCAGLSLFVFLAAWRLFFVAESRLAERMF